jgi:anthranilate/para-aminobenzoate synthase component II
MFLSSLSYFLPILLVFLSHVLFNLNGSFCADQDWTVIEDDFSSLHVCNTNRIMISPGPFAPHTRIAGIPLTDFVFPFDVFVCFNY